MKEPRSTDSIVVTVVVVARNEERNIAPCLESLLLQTYPKEQSEIIVVDGKSTDNTCEIVRAYPVNLIIAEHTGIGYQRNIGSRAARGKYVAFIDADCIADRSWLSNLVESLANSQSPVIAVGGPNLVMESDSPFARLIGYMQETLLGSGGSPQSYRIRERKYVYSIPNCNVAYVADILRNEEYDNRLSMGDDCDLNYRLRRKGYRFLYIPDAVVWHRRPTNLKQFLKKMFQYGEGMAKVTKKNRAVVRWYAFGPALMVMGLLGAYPLVRFVPGMAYVYIAMAGIYLAGLFVSTAQVFRKLGSLTAVRITILLPVQHMSYGLGFLKGLLTERYVKEEG